MSIECLYSIINSGVSVFGEKSYGYSNESGLLLERDIASGAHCRSYHPFEKHDIREHPINGIVATNGLVVGFSKNGTIFGFDIANSSQSFRLQKKLTKDGNISIWSCRKSDSFVLLSSSTSLSFRAIYSIGSQFILSKKIVLSGNIPSRSKGSITGVYPHPLKSYLAILIAGNIQLWNYSSLSKKLTTMASASGGDSRELNNTNDEDDEEERDKGDDAASQQLYMKIFATFLPPEESTLKFSSTTASTTTTGKTTSSQAISPTIKYFTFDLVGNLAAIVWQFNSNSGSIDKGLKPRTVVSVYDIRPNTLKSLTNTNTGVVNLNPLSTFVPPPDVTIGPVSFHSVDPILIAVATVAGSVGDSSLLVLTLLEPSMSIVSHSKLSSILQLQPLQQQLQRFQADSLTVTPVSGSIILSGKSITTQDLTHTTAVLHTGVVSVTHVLRLSALWQHQYAIFKPLSASFHLAGSSLLDDSSYTSSASLLPPTVALQPIVTVSTSALRPLKVNFQLCRLQAGSSGALTVTALGTVPNVISVSTVEKSAGAANVGLFMDNILPFDGIFIPTHLSTGRTYGPRGVMWAVCMKGHLIAPAFVSSTSSSNSTSAVAASSLKSKELQRSSCICIIRASANGEAVYTFGDLIDGAILERDRGSGGGDGALEVATLETSMFKVYRIVDYPATHIMSNISEPLYQIQLQLYTPAHCMSIAPETTSRNGVVLLVWKNKSNSVNCVTPLMLDYNNNTPDSPAAASGGNIVATLQEPVNSANTNRFAVMFVSGEMVLEVIWQPSSDPDNNNNSNSSSSNVSKQRERLVCIRTSFRILVIRVDTANHNNPLSMSLSSSIVSEHWLNSLPHSRNTVHSPAPAVTQTTDRQCGISNILWVGEALVFATDCTVAYILPRAQPATEQARSSSSQLLLGTGRNGYRLQRRSRRTFVTASSHLTRLFALPVSQCNGCRLHLIGCLPDRILYTYVRTSVAYSQGVTASVTQPQVAVCVRPLLPLEPVMLGLLLQPQHSTSTTGGVTGSATAPNNSDHSSSATDSLLLDLPTESSPARSTATTTVAVSSREESLTKLLTLYLCPRPAPGQPNLELGAFSTTHLSTRLLQALLRERMYTLAALVCGQPSSPREGTGSDFPLYRWIPSGLKFVVGLYTGQYEVGCIELLSTKQSDLQEAFLDPGSIGMSTLPHPHSPIARQISAAAKILHAAGKRDLAKRMADIAGKNAHILALLTSFEMNQNSDHRDRQQVIHAESVLEEFVHSFTTASVSSARSVVATVATAVETLLINQHHSDSHIVYAYQRAVDVSSLGGLVRRNGLLQGPNMNIPDTNPLSTNTTDVHNTRALSILPAKALDVGSFERERRRLLLARGGGIGPFTALRMGFGIIAGDCVEDWLSGTATPEIIATAGKVEKVIPRRKGSINETDGGGTVGAVGGVSGSHVQAYPGWVDGVGEGKEWDKVVGYWRFSDIIRMDEPEVKPLLDEHGDLQCLLPDLSKYGQLLQVFRCETAASNGSMGVVEGSGSYLVKLEESSCPVDPGDGHEKVKSLNDVVFPSAPSDIRLGFRVPIPPGGPLDIAVTPIPGDETARAKLTVEVYVGSEFDPDRPPATDTGGPYCILQRVVGKPAGGATGGSAEPGAKILWGIWVDSKGTVCCGASVTSEECVKTEANVVNVTSTYLKWTHIAVIFDSSEAVQQHDSQTDDHYHNNTTNTTNTTTISILINGVREAKGTISLPTVPSFATNHSTPMLLLEDTGASSSSSCSWLELGAGLQGHGILWRLSELSCAILFYDAVTSNDLDFPHRLLCVRLWADGRTAVDIDAQRDNYLSLAAKRKRLQFRIKSRPFLPPPASLSLLKDAVSSTVSKPSTSNNPLPATRQLPAASFDASSAAFSSFASTPGIAGGRLPIVPLATSATAPSSTSFAAFASTPGGGSGAALGGPGGLSGAAARRRQLATQGGVATKATSASAAPVITPPPTPPPPPPPTPASTTGSATDDSTHHSWSAFDTAFFGGSTDAPPSTPAPPPPPSPSAPPTLDSFLDFDAPASTPPAPPLLPLSKPVSTGGLKWEEVNLGWGESIAGVGTGLSLGDIGKCVRRRLLCKSAVNGPQSSDMNVASVAVNTRPQGDTEGSVVVISFPILDIALKPTLRKINVTADSVLVGPTNQMNSVTPPPIALYLSKPNTRLAFWCWDVDNSDNSNSNGYIILEMPMTAPLVYWSFCSKPEPPSDTGSVTGVGVEGEIRVGEVSRYPTLFLVTPTTLFRWSPRAGSGKNRPVRVCERCDVDSSDRWMDRRILDVTATPMPTVGSSSVTEIIVINSTGRTPALQVTEPTLVSIYTVFNDGSSTCILNVEADGGLVQVEDGSKCSIYIYEMSGGGSGEGSNAVDVLKFVLKFESISKSSITADSGRSRMKMRMIGQNDVSTNQFIGMKWRNRLSTPQPSSPSDHNNSRIRSVTGALIRILPKNRLVVITNSGLIFFISTVHGEILTTPATPPTSTPEPIIACECYETRPTVSSSLTVCKSVVVAIAGKSGKIWHLDVTDIN